MVEIECLWECDDGLGERLRPDAGVKGRASFAPLLAYGRLVRRQVDSRVGGCTGRSWFVRRRCLGYEGAGGCFCVVEVATAGDSGR